MTKAILIGPNKLLRDGLRNLLGENSFDVVAQAASVADAIDVMDANPDAEVVLVEFHDDAQEHEFRSLRELRSRFPDPRIVALSNSASALLLAKSLDAGVDSYVPNSISSEGLILALRLTMLGEVVCPTGPILSLTQAIDIYGPEKESARLQSLSAREREILQCLVSGLPNKIAARRMSISESTVKAHVKALLKKLDVANRTQAAIWALKNGVGRIGAADLADEDALDGPPRRTAGGEPFGHHAAVLD